MKRILFLRNVSKRNNNIHIHIHIRRTTTIIITSLHHLRLLNVHVIQYQTTINTIIHILSRLLLNNNPYYMTQLPMSNTTVTAYHLAQFQDHLYKHQPPSPTTQALPSSNKHYSPLLNYPQPQTRTHIATTTTTPLIRKTHQIILYFHTTTSSPSNKPP